MITFLAISGAPWWIAILGFAVFMMALGAVAHEAPPRQGAARRRIAQQPPGLLRDSGPMEADARIVRAAFEDLEFKARYPQLTDEQRRAVLGRRRQETSAR